MLNKVVFTCESCNKKFSVTNPKRVASINLKCVVCGHPQTVRFDTDATVLAGYDDVANKSCRLIYNRKPITLDDGENTIGRESTDHEASTEISTADRSVSRIHIMIEIVKLKSGRQKAIVSDMRSSNKIDILPTEINGMALKAEDRIVLKNRDEIKIGNQILTFIED